MSKVKMTPREKPKPSREVLDMVRDLKASRTKKAGSRKPEEAAAPILTVPSPQSEVSELETSLLSYFLFQR